MTSSLVGSEMCIRDSTPTASAIIANPAQNGKGKYNTFPTDDGCPLGRTCCLLYTSDAADDM
eukprot:8060696-Prorocentrum_lima.AAC.1